MTVRWPDATQNLGEFEINIATQLLPPGFALYDPTNNGPPIRMATHYDPSENDVSDPYMPIDLTASRGARHFIKYEGTDQATIDWLVENLIPIAFDVPEGVDGGPRVGLAATRAPHHSCLWS